MTFVRPTVQPTATHDVRQVHPIAAHRRADLDRLVAADPIVNAVVAARLAATRSLDPTRLGGGLLGSERAGDGTLTGAVFNGGNLLPVGGAAPDWTALAERVGRGARVCTSVVGRADAVEAMWTVLEPQWGPARAVRAQQSLLVLTRRDPRPDPADLGPDPGVRVMHPVDIERYLPAAAAMFTEELGVSPFAGRSGSTYRIRVEAQLAIGRAFGVVDRDGRMAFKADLGALTDATCQVQGVWVRPDLRGRGLGTAALAAVLGHALRLAPTASLYVNDFNVAARRMYAKLGMRQVATLATVLF